MSHEYGLWYAERLADYPQGLMNPYMSTLLRPLTEVLQCFSSSSSSKTAPTDFALWSGVITVLTKSLEADDGGTFVDCIIPNFSPKNLSFMQFSGVKTSYLPSFHTCWPKYLSLCTCPPHRRPRG